MRPAVPVALLVLSACGSRTQLWGAPYADDAGEAAVVTPPLPDASCGVGNHPVTVFNFQPDAGLSPDAETSSISTLLAQDRTIYVGMGPGLGPTGVIYELPASGGTPTPFVTSPSVPYVSGPIVSDGTELYFEEGVATAEGDGFAFAYPTVVAAELATGASAVLPSTDGGVDSLATTSGPGVYFWNVGNDGPEPFEFWDPLSRTTRVVVPNAMSPVIDETDAYWIATDPHGDEGLFSAPLKTGVPTEIGLVPADLSYPSVLALDDTYVYLAGAESDVVLRTPKTGGPVTTFITLADNLQFFTLLSGYAYWVDSAAQDTLMRVSTAGGTPETFFHEDNRFVDAVVTDGCNVYFAIENPVALLAKSM